jgi:hypothetical protein
MRKAASFHCGKRRNSFFEDTVGDLLTYLCKPQPWCNKVIAIALNVKAFDSQFILNRAVLLKWKPELILNGLKIVCMKIEHMTFLDSAHICLCHCVNYLKHSVFQ